MDFSEQYAKLLSSELADLVRIAAIEKEKQAQKGTTLRASITEQIQLLKTAQEMERIVDAHVQLDDAIRMRIPIVVKKLYFGLKKQFSFVHHQIEEKDFAVDYTTTCVVFDPHEHITFLLDYLSEEKKTLSEFSRDHYTLLFTALQDWFLFIKRLDRHNGELLTYLHNCNETMHEGRIVFSVKQVIHLIELSKDAIRKSGFHHLKCPEVHKSFHDVIVSCLQQFSPLFAYCFAPEDNGLIDYPFLLAMAGIPHDDQRTCVLLYKQLHTAFSTVFNEYFLLPRLLCDFSGTHHTLRKPIVGMCRFFQANHGLVEDTIGDLVVYDVVTFGLLDLNKRVIQRAGVVCNISTKSFR